jgi:hypothetical protein
MKAPFKKLKQAARARASGKSWTATATEVGRSVAVVSAWPERFPTEWQQCLQAARAEMQAEAECEAVAILRTQLRDDDVAISAAAARHLLMWVKRPSPACQEAILNDDEFWRQVEKSLSADEVQAIRSELPMLNHS